MMNRISKLIKKIRSINSRHLNPFSSLPSIFAIEINVSCNLRCPECALGGNFISRKRGSLNFDQFRIIADKIRPFSKYLYIMLWGEPLLNNDIIAMIKYASKFTETCISTNAMLINSKNAEELICSGLGTLIVSIDGTTQEVYEKYRVGGDLNKVFDSLKLLNAINIKHGRKVTIIPQFVVFQHNEHQMEQFNQVCKSLHLKPSFKAPYIQDNSKFSNSDNPTFIRKRYKNITKLRKGMQKCQDARKVFTILLIGNVVACCYDYNGVTNFGNIFENEVIDIWNDRGYRQFRKDIISGETPEFCLKHCLEYRLEKLK